ncbi:hypothetical protein J5S49_02125 [Virgibacillus halodenitrificans]|uniref:hypothetical protein n=1 Tax=Virgibacillus halodenitrificans TaxID=1482 RepID=UPI00045D187A|nr:hypothetical protein [Virgibacillus halodenitrificans]MCG1027086.1 hypothetical protein [Virgibacillus halodenitrificans]MYL55924.1 hypothetical protein [Virgibacillus halodenitrificans]CDQ31346.1 hypothetical protein BN993_00721 [Virgibacillus halodenitrificans]
MSALAIFCSVLFFSVHQLEPLIIAGMAGGITTVYIAKKPFTRQKTIKQFINEEI